ncbi:AAA family ATPase [Spongiibacter sp. KMU-158]|uniref:AAA family ATPase n=1 Tax=Spongiibacter pelagi TaxID=2760804 RepID=A0A927C1F5_9GAMM|nr:AAA family ATPase [Spongiibacter pelagi]MBD2859515.1 AAA family ATPase [Spongiibacter pelagi]
MRKILIFGNSGSGKSTLAKRLANEQGLAHLDLDTVAWKTSSELEPSSSQTQRPPERMPLQESWQQLAPFINDHSGWVIEGCYTDLLELLASHASEIIFMNLSVEDCIANAKRRPWEPHKYESKAAQDANLMMLLDWIAQYPERDDTFSLKAHQQFYEGFGGDKIVIAKNVNFL